MYHGDGIVCGGKPLGTGLTGFFSVPGSSDFSYRFIYHRSRYARQPAQLPFRDSGMM